MLIGSAIAAALVVDFLCDRRRIADGSALLAGAIFACLIPLNAPWWIAAIGGAIAIEMGKHWFGGLGQNPFNPAAFSRVLLMSLLPAYFFSPHWAVDPLTGVHALRPIAFLRFVRIRLKSPESQYETRGRDLPDNRVLRAVVRCGSLIATCPDVASFGDR